MTRSILLVGVGGQGIILTSKILAKALINEGFDVKMSEVHGMAQRGGSVTTQVRYGEKVFSPIIGKGKADILIAFEEMEAMRYIEFLNPEGVLIVNPHRIHSAPISRGASKYPDGIIDELKNKVNTVVINASEEARKIGNIRVQNIILLGKLAKFLNLKKVNWNEILKNNIKEKYIDINLKAFETGLNF